MDESLDCIMELMQGEHRHPQDRLVHPERGAAAADALLAAGHGDGGRLLALAGRGRGVGQARHRHAVDRRHVRRGAAGAMPRTGRSTRRRRRKAGKTPDRSKWRIVTFAHVAETREKARADMAYGLADFCQLLHRRRDVPDRAGRHRRSGRVPDQQRACLHRHAGRLHPALRAAVAGLGRRLRRRPAARRTTGRTGRRPSAATS